MLKQSAAAALFALLPLAGCGPDEGGTAQSPPPPPDSPAALPAKSQGEVVAVVNGVELTDSRVSVYLKGLPPLNDDSRGEIVENMISSELIAQAAQSAGMALEFHEDMLVAQQAVLVRNYLGKYLEENPTTDDDLNARYEAFKQELGERKEYLVSHILLPDEDAANKTLAEIQASPERFADLAKERSEDKGSGANGGDIGWSSPENLVPPFADAMQQMQPGEISAAPVQTRFGWHILQLRETRGATAPPLEGRVRQQIEAEARNEKVTQHIEQLRAAAQVELKEAP